MITSRRAITKARCLRICRGKSRSPLEVDGIPISRNKFTQTTVTTSSTEASARSTIAVGAQQPKTKRGLWNLYVESLSKRPLATKATFAAVIFFCSDSATQYITAEDADNFQWSPARALSGSSFGIIATGWLHYWWGFLEAAVSRRLPVATHRVANTAAKVILDQALGAPLYIYTYYVLTNFINEQMTSSRNWIDSWWDTNARAGEMLWPTMLQHWRVWIPVHSVNFHFVPLHHRVLVQNTILVFWSGYLSHLNHNQKHIMTPDEEIKAAIVRRDTLRELEKEENGKTAVVPAATTAAR